MPARHRPTPEIRRRTGRLPNVSWVIRAISCAALRASESEESRML